MSTVLVSNVGGVDFSTRYAADALGASMDAESVYPVDVGPTVLGEIWAPKLFAQGLDNLDLGASGKVAFTADGKRAVDVGVGLDETTGLSFVNGGFRMGTATQDVLIAEPLVGGETRVGLTGDALDITATGATTVTATSLSVRADDTLDVSADAAAISATGDVIFSSDGNPTVTVKQGRVIINGDVEILGTINTTGITNTDTMTVVDDFIEIADGLNYENVKGGLGSVNGLRVNTVPDSLESTAIGAYLQLFSGADGAAAFFTDGALDASKYAAANEVLWKGVLYDSNKGSQASGLRTDGSRLDEPFWDFVGGALQLSRVVPDPDAGVVIKVSMSLRVTDAGEFEVVKQRRELNFVDGEYVDGPVSDAQVVARFGHTSATAPTMLLSGLLAYTLGAVVDDAVAISAYPLTVAALGGILPQGLVLQDNKLVGTVSSVAPADFRLAAVATVDGDESETIETFEQRTGITGIGGGFGRPSDVVIASVGTDFGGTNVTKLFLNSVAGSAWWHSDNASITRSAEFSVTYTVPTKVTHMRLWAHSHVARENMQRLLVYGDDALIAEYGPEARPPSSSGAPYTDFEVQWNLDFTELIQGSTIAIFATGEYTTYRFYFPDLAKDNGDSAQYISLARVQLLNVPADAAAPADLFLTPTTFNAVPRFPSTDVVFTHQLPAVANVTYALARGATLPVWLTLTAEGLLSGQATTLDEISTVDIRALTSSATANSYTSTTSALNLKVVTAVLLSDPSQLIGYTTGDSVGEWGDFAQPDALLQPIFADGVVRLLASRLQRLEIVDPAKRTLSLVNNDGLTIAMHVQIRTIGPDTKFIDFQGPNGQMQLKHNENGGGNFYFHFVGTTTTGPSIPIGNWFTFCFTWKPSTLAYHFYIDGVDVQTGNIGVSDRNDFPFDSMNFMSIVNPVDNDFDVKHVQVHTRELSSADVAAQHAAMAA